MSISQRAVEGMSGPVGLTGGEWDKFAVDFPNIHELFQGLKNEVGQWKIGPASLILYTEDKQLKCCVSPSAFPQVFFTSIPDPLDALQSLENQLKEGRGEWKQRKARR